MSKSITLRIILGILGLIVTFHGPWIFSCTIIIIGTLSFRYYLEAIVLAAILDVVVGYNHNYFFVFAIILVILASFAQRKMSLYSKDS